MSVTISVKKGKREADFPALLNQLAESRSIVYSNLDEQSCVFYIDKVSTREVVINKDEEGYMADITAMATRDDYFLFRDAIKLLAEMTEGEIFYDDYDETIEDIDKLIDEDWVTKQKKIDFKVFRDIILNPSDGKDPGCVGLIGPNCTFYLGRRLFQDLGIDENTDLLEGHALLTERNLYSQYSRHDEINRTSTDLALPNTEGQESVTIYTKNCYDMISYAKYIFIVSDDDKKRLLAYDDFMKIAPKKWERFDNCQYFCTELSDAEFSKLWNDCQAYDVYANFFRKKTLLEKIRDFFCRIKRQ